MPNCTVDFPSGSRVVDWIDEAGTTGHCRLNPRAGQYLKRRKCQVGQPMAIRVLEDGVIPTTHDYHWSGHEAPHGGPPCVVVTDSVGAEVTFTPLVVGHYLLSVRAQQYGRWYIHVDAEVTA